MYLVAALGNKGEKYELTRHNAGQFVLHKIIERQRWPSLIASGKFGGLISEGAVGGSEFMVFFPGTFMNESGSAVKKVLQDEKNENLIVAYDDIALPLGEVRISFGRGDGGHNGLASIINSLDSKDFVRLRIGIAPVNQEGETVRPDGAKLDKYVLGPLSRREQEELEKASKKAEQALLIILNEGYEKAMNEFN